MYWESVLIAAIDVGIAIAGFSGIVMAIGRRRKGRWPPVERVRFLALLSSSFGAIFFAFFPFLLRSAGVSIAVTWQIGSGLLALAMGAAAVVRFRQFARSGSMLAHQDLVTFVFVGALVIVLGLNAVVIRAEWPYLVGVIGALSVAAAQFIRLLVDIRSE